MSQNSVINQQSYSPSTEVAADAARLQGAKAIIGRIKANRGWITRINNQVHDDNSQAPVRKGLFNRYIDAYKANDQTEISILYEELRQLPTKLNNTKGQLDDRYEELGAADPDGGITCTYPNQTPVQVSYVEANNIDVQRCNDLVKDIQRILIKSPTGTASARASTAVKPVQNLRPPPLEEGTLPHLYKEWKAQFLAFFDSSNLQFAKLSAQQGHLRSCLAQQVQSRLFKQISAQK